MFETLQKVPPDPLLSVIDLFRADPRPHKLDLGVGVYYDSQGKTPVMRAIKAAQTRYVNSETTKTYLGADGLVGFTRALRDLALGAELSASLDTRLAGLQAAGGTGALRIGAELAKKAGARRVLIGEPSWPIHATIFEAAGYEIMPYPAYDSARQVLDFDAIANTLTGARRNDVVLLQASCHNPTGADFSPEQWRVLGKMIDARGALAFLDLAYQGLGDGPEADVEGVRHLMATLPQALVAISCSKNFGLYRERTGALYTLSPTQATRDIVLTQMKVIARALTSMPPHHGAALVHEVLSTPELTVQWRDELEEMRRRITDLRTLVSDVAVRQGLPLAFLRNQKGMFSLLPLAPQQVARLRTEFAIYMPDHGRINLVGLTQATIPQLVEGLSALSASTAP